MVDLGKRLAFCRIIVFYVPKNRPRRPEDINGPSGPPKSPSEPRGNKWAQTARFAMGILQLFGGLAFWIFWGFVRDSREDLLGVQIYRIPGFLPIQMCFGGPNLYDTRFFIDLKSISENSKVLIKLYLLCFLQFGKLKSAKYTIFIRLFAIRTARTNAK